MSRTYRAPTWEDAHAQREASKRASTLVQVGAVPPERFCAGKERFPSRNDARHAAKSVWARYAKQMHPYRCPECGWHHLATTEL